MGMMLAVFILAGSWVNGQILLTDSFDGLIVDSTKWDIVNVTPESSVSVQGGVLQSLRQGTIVTKNPLGDSFQFSGRFSGPTTIWFQTDGSVCGSDNPGDTQPSIFGQSVGFHGFILPYHGYTPSGYLHDLYLGSENPVESNIGDYEVTILKEAGLFKIFFDGTKIREFIYVEEFGQKIGIHAGGLVGDPPSLDIFQIEISAIPEPSSLLLLLAGGAVLMAGRRRV